MTLLELITKAASGDNLTDSESEYPVTLNPDHILQNLKPKQEDGDPLSLVCPVTGWQVSQTDSQLIDLVGKFSNNLKQKLKDTNKFDRNAFFEILDPFLEKVLQIIGISVGVSRKHRKYTEVLIENAGTFLGKDVMSLILEACVALNLWELVKCMIICGIVDHSCYSKLIFNLLLKRRSDLVCLCIKHAPVLHVDELVCILKYFLCPPKDALDSMVTVSKELESQGMSAITKASDKNLTEKEVGVARDAAILLMVAYDGFTISELCLHHLLAVANIDEVMLSSAISKLNGEEMASFLSYLEKWLKKYEKFPQACPCPQGSSMLGLWACDLVPKLEDVVRCLSLVLDTNFSSLVLHPEFHRQLTSMHGLVSSLAAEARLCCSLDNTIESLMNASQSCVL
ncbi:uncharacterized protein LOC104433130 [Eucalyptus grandis]|uniref:uncharacterized protein LOC104433130 n=1 Tax=Eucalyptus grandis TaxID=71139 RepID=UPI00192E88F0|nr:uncharacterized protein LOC104433130 [Eucalyptus grandis]